MDLLDNPLRRLPVALEDTVHSQVQEMLRNDIIQPNCSPWSSPVAMTHGNSVSTTEKLM